MVRGVQKWSQLAPPLIARKPAGQLAVPPAHCVPPVLRNVFSTLWMSPRLAAHTHCTAILMLEVGPPAPYRLRNWTWYELSARLRYSSWRWMP